MKILVYGSKGWIGNQFVKYLDNYIEGNSRVDNIDDLKNEINQVNPTHIISFIGRTHGIINNIKYTTIDYLEEKGKLVENVRDNLFCPIALAIICQEKNIHYTYLGTGCIFKFDDNYPSGFVEESLPNFFGSSYSTVKGFTDRLMHFFDKNVLNLRIRMPITGEMNARNFITKITTYDKICSIPNSMTVLPELLPLVYDMMKNNRTGTINLTNPGLISHNQILEMFKDIVDPEFTWKNFSIEEQSKILASDRSNNLLNTTKLKKLYPEVNNIRKAIINTLHQYKKTYIRKKKQEVIKCLLVTGCCGFIGSNFLNYFANKYPKTKIINLDALYYCANKNNIDKKIRE